MNQVGLNSNKILNFKTAPSAQIPQPQFEQPVPEVRLPQIYQPQAPKADANSIKEKIKKWDMMGLIYPWIEHPFMMFGTCAGLAWGVDKFSNSCAGEYESSLVGKAANLGDKIENSKFVKSKPFQTLVNGGKSIKNSFNKVFKNSDLINAIRKTPSEAELGFVKDELLTMHQRVVHEFTNVTKTLNLTNNEFTKLTDLGLDKTEKEFITKFFNSGMATEEMASNAVQLKRIGLADDAIREIINKPDATILTKTKQLEKLGLTADYLKNLESNTPSLKDVIKVREACKKAPGIRIGAGHQNWLGPIQPFERKITLSEIANRLTSMTQAKTKTGKALATFLQKCHRGFTFGGGKIGVLLFVSPLLVETMLDVKKAQPNEKAGTAAHGLVHSISWVFTFPLALSIMHHFGGMQYAGMDKEAVKKSRKLIQEFNEKANPFEEKCWYKNMFGLGERKAPEKTFQTYKEYKEAKDILQAELKKLRPEKNQNFITKLGKGFAKFMTMDLEIIKSYKGKGSLTLGNIGKKVSNVCRNIGGVPLRIALWAGLTMGVLDTLINKGIKGFFGNYYDRYKDEEFENAKKEQKKFLKEDLRARLVEAQNQKNYETMNPQVNNENSENKNISDKSNGYIPESIKQFSTKEPTEIQTSKNEEIIKPIDNKTAEKTSSPKEEGNIAPKEVQPIIIENKNEIIYPKEDSNKVAENSTPVTNRTKSSNAQSIEAMKNNTIANNKKNTNNTKINHTKRDNYTYIPSSENVIKNEQGDNDTNKYIPSQTGNVFTKTFDNSGLEAALRRADRAEQRALQTLAGNFNSY